MPVPCRSLSLDKEQGAFCPVAYSRTSLGEKRRSDAELRPKRGIAVGGSQTRGLASRLFAPFSSLIDRINFVHFLAVRWLQALATAQSFAPQRGICGPRRFLTLAPITHTFAPCRSVMLRSGPV